MSAEILMLTEDEWKIMFSGPAWSEQVDQAMDEDNWRLALEIHKRNIEAERNGGAVTWHSDT